ncbi:hypothetical protein KSF_024720 [Reticulibacter mediterranei]|uniref:Uncharacterized protein n=1 Tax=Reticulibacter mediterranei TaxID=2778369 RepID=A0A8J3MYT7_9CHLR|nr:hypothetical protein [Reticulibacter mediterranei]GHO92424.1 hypothetical protein KSF_024720 [Reticulibacter mediterranei]
MFNFTKKAEIIEDQIELTDEQLTEVTGGATAANAGAAVTGTSVQLGLAVSTDALSANGLVGSTLTGVTGTVNGVTGKALGVAGL